MPIIPQYKRHKITISPFFTVIRKVKVLFLAGMMVMVGFGSTPSFATPEISKGREIGAYLGAKVTLVQWQFQKAHDIMRPLYVKVLGTDEKMGKRPVDTAFRTALLSGDIKLAAQIAPILLKKDKSPLAQMVLLTYALKNKDWKTLEALKQGDYKIPLNIFVAMTAKAWAIAQATDYKKADLFLKHSASKNVKRLKGVYRVQRANLAFAKGDMDKAFNILFSAKVASIHWLSYPTEARMAIRLLARKGQVERAKKLANFVLKGYQKDFILRHELKLLEDGKTLPPLTLTVQKVISQIYFEASLELRESPSYAFAYLQLSRYLSPQMVPPQLYEAQFYEKHDAYKKAYKLYEGVAKGDLNYNYTQILKAQNLISQNKGKQAVSLLMQVQDKKDVSLLANLALGNYYMAKEDYKKAIPIYENMKKAMEAQKRPDLWLIYYYLGMAKDQNKQWTQAEPILLKALSLRPKNPQILNYIAYSWADRNIKLKRALDFSKKAVNLSPGNGYILDTLAWVYFHMGNYSKAITLLKSAAGFEPNNATLIEHFGDVYWAAGYKTLARFQWEQALGLKPATKDIPVLQAKLKNGLVKQTIKVKAPLKTGQTNQKG